MKETAKRDAALELLEKYRSELIIAGKNAAHKLATFNGQVSSPDVIEYLKHTGFADLLSKVDKRFMGAVFRTGEFERIGFANRGSHAQPISVWKLK